MAALPRAGDAARAGPAQPTLAANGDPRILIQITRERRRSVLHRQGESDEVNADGRAHRTTPLLMPVGKNRTRHALSATGPSSRVRIPASVRRHPIALSMR